MSRLAVLPRIMLAPNGARRSRADHPALPVTIPQVVDAAAAAFAEGAGALHAHVRDAEGEHVLDAGLYRELLAEMARVVPAMPVQITTEAVGRYSPEAQRALVRAVLPEGVSVALREMWPDDGPDAEAAAFYRWAGEAGIALQHILYSPADVTRLARLVADCRMPPPRQILFVLGRYTPPTDGGPEDLDAFLSAAEALATDGAAPQWAACAFGRQETACLLAALGAGGAARIGFENNLLMQDGSIAPDNAARVRELVALAAAA